MRQAVVLCGGLGTRMGSIAPSLPKILIEVAGKPFVHHLLERLIASAFDEVILCIGYRGELVREALSGKSLGIEARFSDEGERKLGTAGAIRNALGLLDETFLVTYGDSYLGFDYAAPLLALRADPAALGCMAVYENRGRIEASNAAVRGDRVVRYDKTRAAGGPDLDAIDYGATALSRRVIAELSEGPRGLDELQGRLAAGGQLRAFMVAERFHEIGSPAGLAELERHFANREV